MLYEFKRVKCPICNKGHIADVAKGTKFKIIDIKMFTLEELKNKVILKCPKCAHYAALEII